LGAVALLSPNEVQVAVASSSASLGSSSTAVLLAAISTTLSDASAFRGRQGTDVTTRRRRRRRHDDRVVAPQSVISPPYGFAVKWLNSSRQPLRCIELQFNTEWINSLAFAFDGSFLVSGGVGKCVRKGTSVNSLAAMSIHAQFKWRSSTVTLASHSLLSVQTIAASLVVVHRTRLSSFTTAKRE
jgi:hypothetical protein